MLQEHTHNRRGEAKETKRHASLKWEPESIKAAKALDLLIPGTEPECCQKLHN